jgi:EAL domain-containing protein (putative c-di-GMP-specific phosphodiesterase class I)
LVSRLSHPPLRPVRASVTPVVDRAESRKLEHDLRQALMNDGFSLAFQPRYLLSTRQAIGAEALIRWPHRKRGLVSPSLFIPIAEQSGLINEIGGWVLRQACREAARWPSPAGISVNVSVRQLLDGVLIDQVAEALALSALDPERLELEVTETVLLDISPDVLLTLAALNDLGVGLAIDDFGVGYTSLAMLKRLPFTTMKIDRSMVRALPRDREDAAIVCSLIAIAQALGLSVLAEGIETPEQENFLIDVGCESGQGFLFSHALSAETIATCFAHPA